MSETTPRRPKLTAEQRRLHAQLAINARWRKFYAERLTATTGAEQRARVLYEQSREED